MNGISYKQAQQIVIDHNNENGTLGMIKPNYEYYELIDLRKSRSQIRRGTLRECLEGLSELETAHREPVDQISAEEIRQLVLNRGLNLTDLLDVVIAENGYVGVGLITLGESLSNYCRSKIRKESYESFMSA